MTLREAFGSIEGRVLAYVGDGNNVARSLALVGALAGVRGARRRAGRLPARARRRAPSCSTTRPRRSTGADAVYTDVWVSMSDDEATPARRREALAPYRLDDALLDRAAPARDRAALPARPPGRGDHRGRPLRRPPADLGPGGEPPARAEGAAGAARLDRRQAEVRAVRACRSSNVREHGGAAPPPAQPARRARAHARARPGGARRRRRARADDARRRDATSSRSSCAAAAARPTS